jgi:hypothetical protein
MILHKPIEVTGNSQEEAHVAETVNESAIPQQETTSGNTTKPLTGWGSIKDGVWF